MGVPFFMIAGFERCDAFLSRNVKQPANDDGLFQVGGGRT
ncbi:hypothetical protein HY29_13255 [Hyphomonas beringensis]|uniref:Uncharacterized protein n=1 Tax=Hyphomonas beringensis TaxID=1280946 RepID=A0A062UF81_9PROT|nr:hypothetical protein HY29_13255 [Hyphomonas beringensis]